MTLTPRLSHGVFLTAVAPIAALLFSVLGTPVAKDPDASHAERRAALSKTLRDGNYREAFDGFRALALDPENDPRLVGSDLQQAVQCLRSLNRVHEVDDLLEEVIEAHPKNWRLLQAAAQSYNSLQHGGYLITGKFHRGHHRGGGKVVNSIQRDRTRALQLMAQGEPFAREAPGSEAASFYLSFAQLLLGNRGYYESWRLQYLTDLGTLPDYEDGWGYYYNQQTGAPVDEEGNPIFYHVPESWETAQNDGERWRWALQRAADVQPGWRSQVRFQFATFLRQQFGVETLRRYSYFFGRRASESDRDKSGTYELHTLGEEETIARLATGIRRFSLPDEFNHVKIFQSLTGKGESYAQAAFQALAEIFENRRQYPKAAKHWRANIELGPAGWKKQRLEQIVGNWGRFETNLTQPAGKGAELQYRFRNGRKLKIEAHRIRHQKLLADVKAYLKSGPSRLDWQQTNITHIGQRLVHQGQSQYIGERVAQWNMELDPMRDHFDRRITVSTPLQKAGAYLVTAQMQDGNTSKIIVWLSDTAIVKKMIDSGAYYFVADAVTGRPIPKANLEFFGYYQRHIKRNRYQVYTKNFAEFTDAQGQFIQAPKKEDPRYQWIVTATTKDGRFAYLGFTGVWASQYREAQYDQVKAFMITDRPVYRPGQTVKFKSWVRRAQYDREDTSQFANRSFRIRMFDPKANKILDTTKKSDAYGGVDGEYVLAEDATLGVYNVRIAGYQGISFRVEEYKKPEFEVTIDKPEAPIELGEKISATIRAKYYFGSPVTEAKVKYKVLRRSYSKEWYPYSPWDWLYGPGYWWFAYDYEWYPGWKYWGCRAPLPWWWGPRQTPPEVVAQGEAKIREDGTLSVDIDTALAKAVHPDQDHSYEITAEVVDASRRTIVGRGTVLAARRPFKVFAWVDRGYYQVSDEIRASFSARTLDGKPVTGSGRVSLFQISYDEKSQPVETEVFAADLDTDDEGRASLKMKATESGQYRVSYKVTDAAKHTIEGAYMFTIIGDRFDGSEFRFNDVEVIPDRRDYAPGERVKLQVNTNRRGGTVLLFVRPANGVCLPPQLMSLKGKSTVVEVAVSKKDMPNFFVEALTVTDGKVRSQVREIHVPPEKRVLGVEVLPSADTYKPGEKAKVKVRLTDAYGEPFVGTAALTIYDKSVEYISGGSNIGSIKDFFWKWRRRHYDNTQTSLQRYFPNLVLPKTIAMANLGAFGATVADEVRRETIGDKKRDYFQDGARGNAGKMRAAKAPAGAPVAELAADAAGEPAERDKEKREGVGTEDLVEPTVRKEFADTALWVASLETGQDGIAEVELDMPENLTTWKVKVWGVGHGTKVGEGEAEVITRKNLILRLQAPRFFVEKDEVILSANVHNYLASAKKARVTLELDGETIEPMDEVVRIVEIAADGETRVDWRVRVLREGEAVVRMFALTDEESDAMEMRFPVYVHGMLKMDSFSGVIRPDSALGTVAFKVPEARRIEASRLEVRYSPTLAGAMIDALPYLVEYPYGCTEQTLNRFLPTVITQKILMEMELDLEDIRKKRTNLNAQEIGDDKERAKRWKRYSRNPVFDVAEVQKMVKKGVQALTEMQLSDGGWGWFSGWGEHSYPHTTAVVVHGLQVAVANDVALVPGVLERGIEWLKAHQNGRVSELNMPKPKHFANNVDALIFMVLVDAGVKNDAMLKYLHRDRTRLSVYANAMFGMALHKLDEKEKLAMVLRNIEQFLVEDDENQTAYLNLPGGYWWYWYGSEFEAHAYYLKLLARTDPKGRKASRLVKYLLNNRKHATYWNSTRDTALCIEAMADYLRASGESSPDMVVEVWLDGKKRKEVKITADNLFTFDNRFVLEGPEVTSGAHMLEIRRRGAGPLYFNAYLTNFSLEDYIPKAGLELRVQRKFYKLVPVDKRIKVAGARGQPAGQKVEKYKRIELADLAVLKSGDLVEVELEIESKNDYEYIIFEDMKAAGFETVEVRSGYNRNELGAYMELRDNRVSFFVTRLARGRHSVSYRLRAEIPGRFSALPTRAYAMYAPELKGNSDELKLRVVD